VAMWAVVSLSLLACMYLSSISPWSSCKPTSLDDPSLIESLPLVGRVRRLGWAPVWAFACRTEISVVVMGRSRSSPPLGPCRRSRP
jgi:hypothetical protein